MVASLSLLWQCGVEIGLPPRSQYAGLCVLLLEFAFLGTASSLSNALWCWFDQDMSLPFVQWKSARLAC